MSKKNTYKSGLLEFFVFKTERRSYIAACKQLCILVEHKDLEHAVLEMLANSKRYLRNVIAHKMGEHLLNQDLPEEFYEELTDAAQAKRLEALTKESLADVRNRRINTLKKDLVFE